MVLEPCTLFPSFHQYKSLSLWRKTNLLRPIQSCVHPHVLEQRLGNNPCFYFQFYAFHLSQTIGLERRV